MKSPRSMLCLMKITVEREGREEIVLPDGASPLDVLARFSLLPDAHIVLREGVPIPVDEELKEGDALKLIKVASGG